MAASGALQVVTGRRLSASHRAAISAGLKGRIISAETREKISAAQRGKPRPVPAWNTGGSSWSKGKALSAEHRQNISAANVGKVISAAQRAQIAATLKGRKLAPAHREKSAAWLRRPEVRDAALKVLRHRSTSIERTVAAWMDARGVTYESQVRISKYAADFLVRERRLIIECDGEYWHRNRTVEDARRDDDLRALGYTTVRLTEQAIRSGEARALLERAVA